MPLVIAAIAAVLISILATAIVAFGMIWAFGIPAVVAIVVLGGAYLGLCLVVPLCLLVFLAVAGPTRGDLAIHIAAVALLLVLWLVWDAVLPTKTSSDRQMWLVTFAPAIASVAVHWAAFLMAQRRRRQMAETKPVIPA